MINMRMGYDEGRNRPMPKGCIYEIQRGLGGFFARKGINNNPASAAFDKANIGEVESSNLPDLVGNNLVQPIAHVERCLTLQ